MSPTLALLVIVAGCFAAVVGQAAAQGFGSGLRAGLQWLAYLGVLVLPTALFIGCMIILR